MVSIPPEKRELMSEEKEILLEKMKAIGTIFELHFILSKKIISQWTPLFENFLDGGVRLGKSCK